MYFYGIILLAVLSNVSAQGDPTCQNGVRINTTCCLASCVTCGGPGCESREGGGAGCCSGIIEAAGASCTTNQPPCMITGDPTCQTGVRIATTCCLASCVTCGGAGCDSREGGGDGCCGGAIEAAGASCTTSQPPCMINIKFGDMIYVDRDSDCLFNSAVGDIGVGGVTLVLFANAGGGAFDPASPLDSTTTDENGLYEFGGLAQGNFVVLVTDDNGALDAFDDGPQGRSRGTGWMSGGDFMDRGDICFRPFGPGQALCRFFRRWKGYILENDKPQVDQAECYSTCAAHNKCEKWGWDQRQSLCKLYDEKAVMFDGYYYTCVGEL